MLPARLHRSALSRPRITTAAALNTSTPPPHLPLSASSSRFFSSSFFDHRHTSPLLLRTPRCRSTTQHLSAFAILSARSFSSTTSTSPVSSTIPATSTSVPPPPSSTSLNQPPVDPLTGPLDLSIPPSTTDLLIDNPITHTPLHSYSMSEAWNTASQIAFSPGNDHWFPVQSAQCLLDFIHLYTGLPWWLSIVAATLAVRTLLLPLAIFQYRNGARMTLMRPEMQALNDRFKAKMANVEGVTILDRQQHRTDMQQLMAKYQCNPLFTLASPIASAPIFLSFFFAVQSMHDLHSSFTAGGVGHVFDLSAADPYMILPVLNAATMLIPMEFLPDPNAMTVEQRQRMKNVFRAIAVLFIFLGRTFPAGLFVYWISSNFFTIIQQLLLRSPVVRRMLSIPDTSAVDSQSLTMPAWFGQSKVAGGGSSSGSGSGSVSEAASSVKDAIVMRNEKKVGSVSSAPVQQAGEVYSSRAAAKKNAK